MNRKRLVSQGLMNRIAGGTAAARPTPTRMASDHRRQADQARARLDWTADVYHRRQVCLQETARAGDWVQYGHALKEAGFHAMAGDAYLRALAMDPDDGAEINLQLGHLSKVRGRFDEAEAFFEKAKALGYAPVDNVDFELKLLKKVDNSIVFREVSRHAPRTPLRVFLSVPGGQMSEGDKTAISAGLGQADYSYSFAMRGFVDALDEMEADYTVITNPEYISDIRERSNAEVNLHLSFYPPERVRLLKGAYNVNCFAWEFDRLRLPSEVLGFHAFADQATMLSVPDEVWVPSEHGAEAVRQSGVDTSVTMVSAPVLHNLTRKPRASRPSANDLSRLARGLQDVAWQPLAVLPRIQPQMNEGAVGRESNVTAILSRADEDRAPVVFVSVFNAHDFRKQIGPMIEGFLKFAAHRPEALLLLKMTTPDTANSINDIVLKEQIMDVGRMIPPMISERVWITKQVLTRDELNRLFDMAAYYLCTSYAEGQNLPLIEAMGRGIVPLSVDHTAMESYISEETAVVVPSEKRPFDKRLTARYGLFGLETHFVTPGIVAEALNRAVDLPDEDYTARSAAGHALVRERFGLAPFAETFNALVEALQSGRKRAR